MSEMDISIQLLNAINKSKLVPGCKASRCEGHPDLPSVDVDGQKVNTALFDEVDVSDGRSKWVDQLVPIDFKQGPDPFDDNTDPSTRAQVCGQVSHHAELIFGVQQRLFLFMVLIVGRTFRILRWDRSGLIVSTAIDYYTNWKLFCDILWRISLAHRFAPEMLGNDLIAVRLHPNDEEWKLMTTAAEPHVDDVDNTERVLEDDELTKPIVFGYVRQAFRETLVDKFPRYKVEVPGKDKTRYFLVCRPFFQAQGVIGRGTRDYVALEYDPTPSTPGEGRVQRFVFLKDAWRVRYDGVCLEGDVLAELNNANVQYVPTLVCHGDVGNPVQETETPHYWHFNNPPLATPSPFHSDYNTSLWDEPPLTPGTLKRKRCDDAVGSSDGPSAEPDNEGLDHANEDSCTASYRTRSHVHYRFVVEEVGRPLSTSKTGRKMLVAIMDCVKAHQGAYNLNILHRDISAGNILAYLRVEVINGQRVLRWVGLLTDWEMSKKTDQPPMSPELERAGTWQFMSYGLLSNRSKVFELSDDLESFFHVILYFAVRYLDSNCTDVTRFIEDFFDCYTVCNNVRYAGDRKTSAMTYAKLNFVGVGGYYPLTFVAEAMNSLIFGLMRSFAAYYKVQDYDESQSAVPQASPLLSTEALEVDDDPFIPKVVVKNTCRKLVWKNHKDRNIPTEEERVRAKNVVDHNLFLSIIRTAIFSRHWYMDWKDRARIPGTRVSLRTPRASVNGNNPKRQRMDSQRSLPQAAPKSPPTPSRAPSSKCGLNQLGSGGRGQKRGAPSQRRVPAENQHQMRLCPRNP